MRIVIPGSSISDFGEFLWQRNAVYLHTETENRRQELWHLLSRINQVDKELHIDREIVKPAIYLDKTVILTRLRLDALNQVFKVSIHMKLKSFQSRRRKPMAHYPSEKAMPSVITTVSLPLSIKYVSVNTDGGLVPLPIVE
jgi:hypothetical protein